MENTKIGEGDAGGWRLEMVNANYNNLDASTGLIGWNVTGTRGKFDLRASRKIEDDDAFLLKSYKLSRASQ